MYNNSFEEIIALPTSEGYTMTQVQKIMYVKSNGNYSEVYLADGNKILISKQLQDMESFLLNSLFIRVHQQYLVNKFHVIQYHKEDSEIILISEEKIPVAARKRKRMTTFFKTLVWRKMP